MRGFNGREKGATFYMARAARCQQDSRRRLTVRARAAARVSGLVGGRLVADEEEGLPGPAQAQLLACQPFDRAQLREARALVARARAFRADLGRLQKLHATVVGLLRGYQAAMARRGARRLRASNDAS